MSVTDDRISRGISGWQATALALAGVVSAGAIGQGLGTVLAVLLFAPIVYALVRLRRCNPDAHTTSELVTPVLGQKAATTVGVLQVVAYGAFAAALASSVGVITLNGVVAEPMAGDAWLAILVGIAVTVVAAVAAFAIPARIVTTAVAVLVAVSVLAVFYLALAVVAKALSEPDLPLILGPSSEDWPAPAVVGTLVALALGLVGFELATTHLREDTPVGRPMIVTFLVAAVVAVVAWYAVHASAPGTHGLTGADLPAILISLFGGVVQTVSVIGASAGVVAGMLAMMLAIVRITGRAEGALSSEAVFAVSVLAIVLLVVATCSDWLSLSDTIHLVGALPLLIVYALLNEANARLDDGVTGWWLRITVPVVLVAIAVLGVLATIGVQLADPG